MTSHSRVKTTPVIAQRNSYVIEIRGVPEFKDVPAADVPPNGDIDVILTIEF